MKYLLAIPLLMIACATQATECKKKPVVVAVIDTGFGFLGQGKGAKLCKFGHRDFTISKEFSTNFDTVDPVPTDNHGHGTNIAGVIEKNAGIFKDNYCLVIIKYYDSKIKNEDALSATIEAVKYATNIKADYINYSGGGGWFDDDEKTAVENFIHKGGKFIAAAGNEKSDIDKIHYYPAYYPGVVSVGNLSPAGKRSPTSNYGKSVKHWEIGEDVEAYGLRMTGTSQAAAIATGKFLSKEKSLCH